MAKELWWKNIVIYEVYVDKFAGDFKGMARRLDYLKKLGVNCVWILPHFPSPMVDDGYDVSDYYNVRKELGTLDDFRDFVAEAHRKGIKVIIDLVLNHVSVEHPWFKEASSSPDSSKRDYFLWSKTGTEFQAAYNPFSHMTMSNWAYNHKTDDYYFSRFFHQQADLNWNNQEVFKEITGIIDFWAKLGVDGFRLDAAAHLIKKEGSDSMHLPETHNILKRLRKHVDDNQPGVILLAEASGPVGEIRPYFGNGDECHMVFNFPLMSNIYLAIKNNDMSILENIAKESLDIPENSQWATFVNNHDEITFTPLAEPEREEMVSWLDPENIYSFRGGRGVSMRLWDVFRGDKEKIINIFRILFSLPGSPVIYYGSEIGMRNLKQNWELSDTRKYLRGDFDWKEAEAQINDPGSIFNIVAKMARKRLSLADRSD